MPRAPINSHHGLISNEAPSGLMKALDLYAPGIQVEAEYGFFETATTLQASEQLQIMKHNGRHSWIEKLEAALFDESSPDGFWKRTEVYIDGVLDQEATDLKRVEYFAGYLNVRAEANQLSNLNPSGETNGGIIFASATDPNALRKFGKQLTSEL